jgi:dTDP-4-amino-4,6-dideoxygalactose transaminase
MIPIIDLAAQYRTLKVEIDTAVQRVLASGIFIMGPNVEAFESEIAAYIGVPHAIALNSGTDALHLALRALDIGPGDEVITSPFTFAATSEAIGIVGATPVFVDIDPETFNIDPSLIESAVTSRTKAVLPVHLYGAPASLDKILAIAKHHGIAVVEDCAQAIGAELGGRKVGAIGDIGCFSFFPTKNLGAYGDGGLITSNDGALAERIRALRAHGGRRKYYHDELGINSRLDELQAAILRVKLPHLDTWISARRKIAQRYTQALESHAAMSTPKETSGTRHVYHQYTVRVSDRDEVRKRLTGAGVQTMVYYPVPLHLQNMHKDLIDHKNLLHSEDAARQVLSLPMYPELSELAQAQVIEALKSAVGVESAA